MNAGERRVRTDFSADRGEFGQTNSRINFISGSRPAAAQLDDREPDRSYVDAGDEAAPLWRCFDDDRRLRQSGMIARDEILWAAERRDHALEPLRRRARLERAPQRRGARVHVVREP